MAGPPGNSGVNMETTSKVLVIDSDRETASQLREHLGRAGFETVHCANGREGIQRFLELMPHAVIVRDVLPGLDGWETARRIREMSAVPIMFISSRRDVFSIERALHIGDDFFSPPWNWQRLTAKRRRKH
jgi:two-component system, OmpR family, response regulator